VQLAVIIIVRGQRTNLNGDFDINNNICNNIEDLNMGTLFAQKPRPYYVVDADELDDQIKIMVELSKAHKTTLDQVISISHVLELKRANDLYAYNGDAFDEQMQGFGELLQELIYAMSKTNDE